MMSAFYINVPHLKKGILSSSNIYKKENLHLKKIYVFTYKARGFLSESSGDIENQNLFKVHLYLKFQITVSFPFENVCYLVDLINS